MFFRFRRNRGFCFRGLEATLVDVESGVAWRKSSLFKTRTQHLTQVLKEHQDRRKGFCGFCYNICEIREICVTLKTLSYEKH